MDYEKMAKAGIEMVVEPSFWLGEPRKYAGTFFDYFDHIINFETERASRYGIKHFVTISMNPKESNNRELTKQVIDNMPRYLEKENVVGVGEIGFDAITPAEEDSIIKQLKLARDFNLPVIIHSPHLNKLEGIKKTVAILKQMNYDMGKIVIDHNTEETIAFSKGTGAWCGHTVYPITKLTPQRAADIIKEQGVEKMMINSSGDWGPSDPLCVVYTIEILRREGFSEGDIEKLVWYNPYNFFSQSGRLK